MYQRSHFQILTKRIKEPRRFIQVIVGPRQVGKTTVVTQLIEENDMAYHFTSADAVAISDSIWLRQQWEIARIKAQTTHECLLIIDEIQKIENWSETVKRLWDEDSISKNNIKVILLGSSRLLLQQGLTESLAGRFETIYMNHWSFKEMKEAFGWTAQQYAWFGGYPGSASLIEDEVRWKTYVKDALIETSISKDILMLSRVDKPALMKRLFELGCLYSSQILSFTKIIGQIQDAGNTTTLSHYLNLLDTAGLLAGIEKFSPEVIRQRSSSPKFQVHNTALISAQRYEKFNEILVKPDEWGRIIESTIGAYLMHHTVSGELKLYYWRERNEEVDFILEYQEKIIAIEVQSNAQKSTSGMQQFTKKYNPSKVLLIGNAGMPWEEFLTIDPRSLF